MKSETNIAEILRGCPKGTRVYSTAFGEARLLTIDDDGKYPIVTIEEDHRPRNFTAQGRIDDNPKAACILFPSDKMRRWDKFFKRGDIVYNPYSQMYAVFECWTNDDYTEFNTTINYYKDHTLGEGEVCDTGCFVKANDEQKTLFIAAAEKHYGGKYNPETLQVEPVKVAEPKCPFEPFQKVLARGNIFSNNAGKWKATFFSHKIIGAIGPLYECGAGCYKECIPYNDETKHLIGTENPYNKTESND